MSFEDRSWMYDGWNSSGSHSQEWVHNTDGFLERAFQGVPHADRYGVVCPCSECCNRIRRKRHVITVHLCQRGFMPGYTRWTKHEAHPIRPFTSETAYAIADGLNDMLGNFGDAMDVNIEDEPQPDAKAFYEMLSASQEPLHDFTQISCLTTVTRLMGIISQHNFSGECMNSLLRLFGDVRPV